jgi:hypothetical protein
VTALVLLWLTAAGLATLMVFTMATGISDAVLAAELTAVGVLAATAVAVRRGGAPGPHERRVARAHRERRGF